MSEISKRQDMIRNQEGDQLFKNCCSIRPKRFAARANKQVISGDARHVYLIISRTSIAGRVYFLWLLRFSACTVSCTICCWLFTRSFGRVAIVCWSFVCMQWTTSKGSADQVCLLLLYALLSLLDLIMIACFPAQSH